MQEIAVTDFSGGVVENVSPSDFTDRQCAQLKGFIPSSQAIMETQWPMQKLGEATIGSSGNNRNFSAVFPLTTADGVFLIAIKHDTGTNAGSIWWAEAPGVGASNTACMNTVWRRITTDTSGGNVVSNFNYRFLTDLTYEVYKYDKTSVAANTKDDQVPGVLIGARRVEKIVNGQPDIDRASKMLVAFYDPNGNADSKIKISSFPMESRKPPQTGENQIDEGITFPSNFSSSFNLSVYPYSYTSSDGALFPGRGVIPLANVAARWGNALILGDVFWREEGKKIATSTTANPLQALKSGNTTAYEGAILYGEDDIDKFDPRSLIPLSTTGTSIRGLHVLDNTLIAITSFGGNGDGVIALRGNLGQLHPYDGSTPNPFAIRKELVRGGLGMVDRPNRDIKGQIGGSCVWPDAGLVVFVDRLGGVWYTDGETCGRLDENGPIIPAPANRWDHVGAIGKHLFVWRGQRLWVLSIVGQSPEGAMSAAWTELVLPGTPSGNDSLRSMAGARSELYFIWGDDKQVWRVALNGPTAERGKANNVTLTLTMSTRTMTGPSEMRRTVWHRFGMTFETPTSCTVQTVEIQSVGAMKQNLATWINPLENVGNYQIPLNNQSRIGYIKWTLNRSYSSGNEGDFVVPAGIGSQQQASATVTFTGYVRLQTASFWVTGTQQKRGEVPS
jgi:hypothetical protein